MAKKNNSIESTLKDSLIEFIRDVANSYAAWDIITFFYIGREKKVATVDEIFDSIGRDIRDIIPVLENFIKRGYVTVEEKDGKKYYSITTDNEKFGKIGEFVGFAETREGRLKIIYFITKYRMAR